MFLHYIGSVSTASVFTTQDGKTALLIASQHGYAGVVRVLIGAHAHVDLQDEVKHTSSGRSDSI